MNEENLLSRHEPSKNIRLITEMFTGIINIFPDDLQSSALWETFYEIYVDFNSNINTLKSHKLHWSDWVTNKTRH